MSKLPLILILDGAAEGTVRVHYSGYNGGPVLPSLRKQLHAGLNDAIALANRRAKEPARDGDARPCPVITSSPTKAGLPWPAIT